MFCIIVTLFSLPIFLVKAEIQIQPHIIFVVADDLGWNDVSWHNPKIYTPNLETLAREGVILNQSYVQAICTPSRVSFMTGYYPYHVGRQNHVLHPLVPTGVPLRFKFLPEKLREIGYSTHMIGKWHLGYCNLSYTPTQRGFDTFFGFYNGALDYYSHTRSAKRRGPHAKWNEPDLDVGFDLRNNSRASRKYNGVYSTTLIANAAKDLIRSHDPEVPLYLYLSFQSVHGPLQVPKNYEDMYSHIPDVNRKKFSGMVSAMDDAIGNVVRALKDRGFWENSLFVFTTDNGGQTAAGGNNWPLRGNKGTQWEGATRAITFIHKSSMKKNGYVNDKLFHAVDWFPTLLGIAGGKPENIQDLNDFAEKLKDLTLTTLETEESTKWLVDHLKIHVTNLQEYREALRGIFHFARKCKNNAHAGALICFDLICAVENVIQDVEIGLPCTLFRLLDETANEFKYSPQTFSMEIAFTCEVFVHLRRHDGSCYLSVARKVISYFYILLELGSMDELMEVREQLYKCCIDLKKCNSEGIDMILDTIKNKIIEIRPTENEYSSDILERKEAMLMEMMELILGDGILPESAIAFFAEYSDPVVIFCT